MIGVKVAGETVIGLEVAGETVFGLEVAGEAVIGLKVAGEEEVGLEVTGELVIGVKVAGEAVIGLEVAGEALVGVCVEGEIVTGLAVDDTGAFDGMREGSSDGTTVLGFAVGTKVEGDAVAGAEVVGFADVGEAVPLHVRPRRHSLDGPHVGGKGQSATPVREQSK